MSAKGANVSSEPLPKDSGAPQAPQGSGPRVVPPPRPVERPSRAGAVAAVLKLGSALCGLAAAALLVLPAVRGEFNTQPRLLTLTPTFGPAKDSTPVASPEPPGEERPPVDRTGQRDPFVAPEPDPVIQEERADFDGAILVLESEPSGATAFVDGKDQGETPVSVGLDCLPGKPVQVEFVLRGHQRLTHQTLCPKDAMLKLTARMRKAEKGSESTPAPKSTKGSRKRK